MATVEELHAWKEMCDAAITELPRHGPTVHISAKNLEAAATCLNMYLLHLHTHEPERHPSFIKPVDTTCTPVALTAFLQEHRLYFV
jgi:hypothetical protein